MAENLIKPFRGAVFCWLCCLEASMALAEIPEDACTNNQVPRTTPSSDFTVLGDGSAVRHESTGLDWQRCALGQSWNGGVCEGSADRKTWSDALEEVANVGDGWRLPNVNELRSIVEECRVEPAINREVFPGTSWSHYHSASPDAMHADYTWKVDFRIGIDVPALKTGINRIRLVRGGE